MFETEWTAVRYLVCLARARVRAAGVGDRESGALSLEWIIIAATIAAIAVGALVFFSNAVTNYTNKLP